MLSDRYRTELEKGIGEPLRQEAPQRIRPPANMRVHRPEVVVLGRKPPLVMPRSSLSLIGQLERVTLKKELTSPLLK